MQHNFRTIFVILFIFTFISNDIKSQNLIPNPSFEYHTACPDLYSQNDSSYGGLNMKTLRFVPPWTQPTNGTSDFFYDCGNVDQFFLPRIPIQNGKGFTAILLSYNASNQYVFDTSCLIRNNREYIQAPLLSTLKANQKYYLSFWIHPAPVSDWFTDAIGAYFTPDAISNFVDPFRYNTTLSGTPQISNPIGRFISDTTRWTKIEGTFTATGNEKYITIGNFKGDMETTVTGRNGDNKSIIGCTRVIDTPLDAYVMIDNLNLLECSSNKTIVLNTDTVKFCFGVT